MVRKALLAILLAACVLPSALRHEEAQATGEDQPTSFQYFGWSTPALALNHDGNPVIAFKYGDIPSVLGVIVCTYARCLPPPTAEFPGVGAAASDISLAMDSAGNPVILYRSSQYVLVRCNDLACRSADETVTLLQQGGPLILNAQDHPVFVVAGSQNGQAGLALETCNDEDCRGGDETTSFVTTVNELRDVKLVPDASGNPVIAYQDHGSVFVAHCNDALCAGGDESVTNPHVGPSVGWALSLALDPAGNPVMSYHDANPGGERLIVLHCNDPDCAGSDESITMPDRVAWIQGTSIAVDSAGDPVVAYEDYIHNALVIMHCNDPDCSGNDDPKAAVGPGSMPSLQIDTDGNPIVAYLGNDYYRPSGLTLLECTDPSCGATGLPGDANGDGVIDSVDALEILQFASGSPFGPFKYVSADANGDHEINSLDALFILQRQAGLLGG